MDTQKRRRRRAGFISRIAEPGEPGPRWPQSTHPFDHDQAHDPDEMPLVPVRDSLTPEPLYIPTVVLAK